MKIGYVQMEPRFGAVKENVEKAAAMIKGVEADLLVLPELFNTGYYITDPAEVVELAEPIPSGFTTRRLEEIAKEQGACVVAGVMEREGDKFYNSAALVGPGGYVGHYRKIHLFSEETIYFSPGDRPFAVYDMGIARVGIMICYDWFYPESMRILALLGADIVAHPANLVMPYCPGVMPFRCFDNKVFSITSDRIGKDVKGKKSLSFIGNSLICGPDGKVLIQGPGDEEQVGVVEIDPAVARNKRMNQYNDLFKDRRPEMYGPLMERG